MLSEVIQTELSYSAMPLAGTADRPEVRSLRSSRTRSKPPQESTPAVDRRPTCLTHLVTPQQAQNYAKLTQNYAE